MKASATQRGMDAMSSHENTNTAAGSPGPAEFSMERVGALVAALERELQNAPADHPNLPALRQEIAALKGVLEGGDDHAQVKEKLHSVRGTLQDMTARVESEVLQDSRYIAEMGRILGLV